MMVFAVGAVGAGQVIGGGPGQVQMTVPGQQPAAPPAPGRAAVSGVVTDAVTNRPIGGVTVSLGMDRPVGLLRPPSLSQTITDAKGRFVFWPVAPGTGYFVNATAFGYFGNRGDRHQPAWAIAAGHPQHRAPRAAASRHLWRQSRPHPAGRLRGAVPLRRCRARSVHAVRARLRCTVAAERARWGRCFGAGRQLRHSGPPLM